jgi:hypothetical protein
MSIDLTTLAAGRELDAIVAERVMGIAPRDVRIKGETNTVRIYSDNLALADGLWERKDLEWYGSPPRYSTQIETAWQLVERMRELGSGVSLSAYPPGGARDAQRIELWRCRFGLYGGDASGDTASLAICRAALAAVEAVHA